MFGFNGAGGGGGGGTLQGGESKVSRKVAVQLRLQNGEPKASSLLHGGNGWSPEGSTARAASWQSSLSCCTAWSTCQQGVYGAIRKIGKPTRVTDYSSTKNSSTKTPRYDRRSNDKSRIRKVHDTKFPWCENSSLRQCTTWQIPDATYRRCVSFATQNVTDAKTPRKNFPRKVSYSWRLLVVGL